MAVVVDEFVVKLGLDPTQFSKGQRDAVDSFKKTQEQAKSAAQGMEADGKQAARFYSNIKSEALSLIAVLVGAKDIAGFMKSTVTDLSAVGRLATVMGVPTQNLQAIAMAVQRIGGDGKAAQQSLLGLTQTLEGWKLGQRPGQSFLQAFGFIGGNVSDDPLKILQKFADFADRTKNKQLVERVGTNLGLNQDLINEAIQGRKTFDADIADSFKNGIPTDADIKKVQALQKAWFDLAQQFRYIGTELVTDVADPLTGLLTAITTFAHNSPGVTKALLAFAAAVTAVKTLGTLAGIGRFLGGAAPAAETAAGGPVLATAGAGAGLIWLGIKASPEEDDGKINDKILTNPNSLTDPELKRALQIEDQQRTGSLFPWTRAAAAGREEALAQIALKRWGDPRTGSIGTERQGGGLGSGAVSAAAREAQSYLLAHGFSASVALGVAGGITAEGGQFGKRDQYDGRGNFAFGIEQLRGSRLHAFMAKYGPNPTKAQELAWLVSELMGTAPGETPQDVAAARTVLGAGSAKDSSRAYLASFMRPGPGGLMRDLRRDPVLNGGGDTNVTVTITVPGAGDPRAVARHVNQTLARTIAANSNNSVN